MTRLVFTLLLLSMVSVAGPPVGDHSSKAHDILKSKGIPAASAYCHAVLANPQTEAAEITAVRTFMSTVLRAARADAYGTNYANLQAAREALVAGDHDAVATYTADVGGLGPLREAADIVRLDSLILSGEFRDADAFAKEMNRSVYLKWYTGELRLRQAELAYLSGTTEGTEKRALQHLDACIDWISTARSELPDGQVSVADILRPIGIDKEAKRVLTDFPVGERLRLPGDSSTAPETMLNPVTTSWYLDALVCRARLLQIAIQAERTPDAADEALTKLASILRLQADKRVDLQQRLRISVQEGAFLIAKSHWKDTRNWKRTLQLASFYTVAGDTDRARQLFNIPSYQPNRRLTNDELAIQSIGLACIARSRGDSATAHNLLQRFQADGPLQRHPLVPLADYLRQTL